MRARARASRAIHNGNIVINWNRRSLLLVAFEFPKELHSDAVGWRWSFAPLHGVSLKNGNDLPKLGNSRRARETGRRCRRQFLSSASRDYIFNFVEFLDSFPAPRQGSTRCSRLFRSCLTRRSILPGQFRRSKNTRLTRRPYRPRRKSITPVRRSVRWVAKMYGRHAIRAD